MLFITLVDGLIGPSSELVNQTTEPTDQLGTLNPTICARIDSFIL
jgi:hypothetical protein